MLDPEKTVVCPQTPHNYIDTPEKGEKTTPAMRLGLADAVLDYGDVLYFRE